MEIFYYVDGLIYRVRIQLKQLVRLVEQAKNHGDRRALVEQGTVLGVGPRFGYVLPYCYRGLIY